MSHAGLRRAGAALVATLLPTACVHTRNLGPFPGEEALLVQGVPRSARVGETVTFWAGFTNGSDATFDFVEMSFGHELYDPDGPSYAILPSPSLVCWDDKTRHRLHKGGVYLALVTIRLEHAGTEELRVYGQTKEVSGSGKCVGKTRFYMARLEFNVVD